MLFMLPAKAPAAEFDGLFAGSDDFGDVGLLQTPTARMRPDGDFGFGVSTTMPYNQLFFFLQPLPWLETAVRYTDLTNHLYSNDPSFSGTQNDKDKSADAKIRLLNEGKYWPTVSVGLQDIGGVGLFSSEYLVSSYHYFDFDFSFGIGWGRLGSGGGISNPLGLISSRFKQSRTTSTAGSVDIGRLFSGPDVGPFGGVEWITPIKGLALRVEYDGNDYQHEPFGNNLRQNSRINYGLAYRGLRGLDLGVGLERGNTVMGRVVFYTNFQSFHGVLKTADPIPVQMPPKQPQEQPPEQPADKSGADLQSSPAVAQNPTQGPNGVTATPRLDVPPTAAVPATVAPVVAVPPSQPPGSPTRAAPGISPDQEKAFVLQLKQALKQQGFNFIALDYDNYQKEVRVWLSQDMYRNPAKAVGRTARVLCATAPADISKFTLVYVNQGVESYRVAVQRAEFEKAANNEADLDTGLSAIRLMGPGDGFGSAEYFDSTRFPKFTWDMGPAVRQSVGGPNGFYYGQLYWKVGTGLALTDHINLTGAAGFNIINNFNDITLQSNSTLPHVRSDIVKYLQQGPDGVINLEADYTWSPYPEWYHRMSVGIFEEMYAGVATELLFKPYGRSWAVALDINRVKQRGYAETFDFLPYTVTTGHATIYYKPGYFNLLFKLSGGQYLARDRGGTLDISREFDNGVRAGIFATKTNVSAAQFGEGQFDKGLYIILPLDLFFNKSTRREAGFTFRPLTRDGGQMVYDGPELYSTVNDGQPSDFAKGAQDLLH